MVQKNSEILTQKITKNSETMFVNLPKKNR